MQKLRIRKLSGTKRVQAFIFLKLSCKLLGDDKITNLERGLLNGFVGRWKITNLERVLLNGFYRLCVSGFQ
jgi:hypothetical protein